MKPYFKQLASVFVLLAVVLGQFAYPQPVFALPTTRYAVPVGGLTSGTCSSWATACDLQTAINSASAVDGDQVWVQVGTYYPTVGSGREATITLKNGVAVYGGFAFGDDEFSDRSTDPSLTILSGDLGTLGSVGDNAFHVVTIDNAGTSTILDGFTVTLGYVVEADSAPKGEFGAGIYISNSSPTLNNLIISNNRAGTTVGSGGGGMFINDTDTGTGVIAPQITDVTFINNRSGRGGGLFSQNSNPELTNVTFENNEAIATGGGGMNSQTTATFDPPIDPKLTNVTFINNLATGGGGLFIGNSFGELTNVTFSGNTARRRGGGLLLEFSTAVLTNVTFHNNVSQNLNTYADPRGGGGLMNIAGSPTLNNVTFSGNTSDANGADGGAMRNAKHPDYPNISNPVINNSIFWDDNSSEITHDESGTVTITINDSVVEGGCPAFSNVTCNNVINANPVLGALASNGGDTQTLSLGVGSSAIDTGNDLTCATTDQRGVSRPQGSHCDIGAYELEVAAPSFTDTSVANFNAGTVGSCVVDNTVGDGALRLNIPSSNSCVFESRIFNAGQLVRWDSLTSTVQTPAGTSVTFETRTGNTSTPDSFWSVWYAVSGPLVSPGGRYIQYRATLSTTDSGQTPVLEQVTLDYTNRNAPVLLSPTGTLSSWGNSFSWTGLSDAGWYFLQVFNSSGTEILRRTFTAAQAGCAGGTACGVTGTELQNLMNGEYTWRVLDVDTNNVYGVWAARMPFTMNATCYSLTTGVSPSGSGVVNATAPNCGSQYTAGTVVQLSMVPNAGYKFLNWSGDASGTTSTTSVTMNGNKSVTANLRGVTLQSPNEGTTDWDRKFSWSGPSTATWYLLEVQTSTGSPVLLKWYTPAQAGCAGGTECGVTPAETLNLANGSYKWRIRDYGAYGYGEYTLFKNFTLNAACYDLNVSISPSGSGVVNVTAPNCGSQYTAGSTVRLSVVVNAGYKFVGWSGDASGTSNPLTITIDGAKSITANLRGVTLQAPEGTLSSWDHEFSWSGPSTATWYLLEVQTSTGSPVLLKWYSPAQAGCAGGTECGVTPAETLNLANGSYKWRIRDYGAYGYGEYTPFKNFTLSP